MNQDNSHHKHISRRDFLRLGSSGAALAGLTALTGSAIAQNAQTPNVFGNSTPPAGPGGAQAAPVNAQPGQPQAQQQVAGKLPTRRYGRTGLQISTLIGAGDFEPTVIPYMVQAGVNYWHKAQIWGRTGLPEAIKSQPRESYHLEVVVDRVDGDNKTGRIDEERHYQFVKNSVKALQVAYIDVMKFHFGYHSIDEAKNETGMIRAFNRLKKEGLVKHLTISQHSYNNKDVGGNVDHEILDYIIDNLPYEAAQFWYTYGDVKETADVIEKAGKKDFGVIAMKTMRGVRRASADPKFAGAGPGGSVVKWLMTNPNISAAVVMQKSMQQWMENSAAAMQPKMAAADHQNLDLLAAYNKGLTCLLCDGCVSKCPEHIPIADIFRFERYACDYEEVAHARKEYAALTKKGTACIACGDCIPDCPASINIIAKLKQVHNMLA